MTSTNYQINHAVFGAFTGDDNPVVKRARNHTVGRKERQWIEGGTKVAEGGRHGGSGNCERIEKSHNNTKKHKKGGSTGKGILRRSRKGKVSELSPTLPLPF